MTKEELRYEMLEDNIREERLEIALRRNDDVFATALVNEFEDSMRELEISIDNFCSRYGREHQTDEWFEFLLEK
jgi:hypothetical protein